MDTIQIWGDKIPYNQPERKKFDSMLVKSRPKPAATLGWVLDVFGTKITKDASRLDTFTWLDEIKTGKMSSYFDDVPTLKYYPVKGADTAVIIAPGGGFCNQSREKEGYKIAEFLNKNRIAAFVLEYRLNPYEAPVCYLDMQRAIRYVRRHAEAYGLRPDRIGAMGFSAGGYVVGASAILLKDTVPVWDDYVPDEVDAESGRADFLGLIYPVTAFDCNPNMLCLLAGDDAFDDNKRPALQMKYSLIENLTSECPPQFLCYGTKDPLKDTALYAARLEKIDPPHETYVLEGAPHGFGLQKKYAHWGDAFVQWVRRITGDESRGSGGEIKRTTAFSMAAVPPMPYTAKAGSTSQLRIPLNVSGTGLILRFSNQFGSSIGVIDHAAVAVVGEVGQKINPVFKDILVRGQQRIAIPAGQELVSDPIPMVIKPGTEIIVQVFCKDKAQTVCGVGYLTRTAVRRGKDQVGTEFPLASYSSVFEKLFNQAPIQNVSYLKTIDVIIEDMQSDHSVISCFGDSITAQNRWVWPLTEMLNRQYPGKVSVLNFGICGNRLLSDPDPKMAMFGQAGLKRVEWDSFRDQGVTHMIVALGGNDIGMGSFRADGIFSPTPEEFRTGCQQLVEAAHTRGIQVYALSIYPAYWNRKDPLARNRVRLQYLDVQHEVFDGFIDIEDALKDGECGYKPGYGYGDNCHLREPGGEAVAKEVFAFMKNHL